MNKPLLLVMTVIGAAVLVGGGIYYVPAASEVSLLQSRLVRSKSAMQQAIHDADSTDEETKFSAELRLSSFESELDTDLKSLRFFKQQRFFAILTILAGLVIAVVPWLFRGRPGTAA